MKILIIGHESHLYSYFYIFIDFKLIFLIINYPSPYSIQVDPFHLTYNHIKLFPKHPLFSLIFLNYIILISCPNKIPKLKLLLYIPHYIPLEQLYCNSQIKYPTLILIYQIITLLAYSQLQHILSPLNSWLVLFHILFTAPFQ